MVAEYRRQFQQIGTRKGREGVSFYRDCCYPPFLMTCEEQSYSLQCPIIYQKEEAIADVAH